MNKLIKIENTEENNRETASESKQTEEETKQTETTETGTEDASKEKAHSKETAEKETTEEIQQDGSLYDMGGEMRKASRVAKVGLRKAAGGLDSGYVYLDTTGMDLKQLSYIFLEKRIMDDFIRDKKSRFMANPIGDGKLMAKIINLHLSIKLTGTME